MVNSIWVADSTGGLAPCHPHSWGYEALTGATWLFRHSRSYYHLKIILLPAPVPLLFFLGMRKFLGNFSNLISNNQLHSSSASDSTASAMKDGAVFLLKNLRLWSQEQ